jgi:hypothetical protein
MSVQEQEDIKTEVVANKIVANEVIANEAEGNAESGGPSSAAEAVTAEQKPQAGIQQEPEEQVGKGARRCRHIKEDGTFCQSPALRERDFCWSHLRIRGQRMRMARERMQRRGHRVMLPVLEDLHSVQVGLQRVGDALAAGVLEERRAWPLLFVLQQAGKNLRSQVSVVSSQLSDGAGPESSNCSKLDSEGQRTTDPSARAEALGRDDNLNSHPRGWAAGPSGGRDDSLKEYPGFEEEFGLPEGIDLGKPPEVVFPPPAVEVSPGERAKIKHCQQWTADSAELAELEKQEEEHKDDKTFIARIAKVRDRMYAKARVRARREYTAQWQTEADRRNAEAEEEARDWTPEKEREYYAKVLAEAEARRAEEARHEPLKES